MSLSISGHYELHSDLVFLHSEVEHAVKVCYLPLG